VVLLRASCNSPTGESSESDQWLLIDAEGGPALLLVVELLRCWLDEFVVDVFVDVFEVGVFDGLVIANQSLK
jgi:hypothetical protein